MRQRKCATFGYRYLWLLLGTLACSGGIDTGEDDRLELPPDSSERPETRVLTELFRIGERNESGLGFGEINAIAVDELDRVYVADAFSKKISVFGPDGDFLRAFGREGSGPGELLDPEGLTWLSAESLLVVDYGNGRYTAYDTTGVHEADHLRGPLGALWPWPGRFVGSRLVESLVAALGYRLVLVDPVDNLQPIDTFPFAIHGVPTEYWEPQVWVTRGTAVRRMKLPFAAGVQWAIDHDGYVWVGDTRSYRIFKRTLEGDTLLSLSRELPPVAVSSEESRRAMESLGPNPPIRASDLPTVKPFFRVLIPNKTGGLWVLREGIGDDWVVDAFDAEGDFVDSLSLPITPYVRVLPVLKGESLWMVAEDDLGIQSVVRLGGLDGELAPR